MRTIRNYTANPRPLLHFAWTLALLLPPPGFIAAAQADDDIPTFAVSIRDHTFSPADFTVPADTRIRLNVKNEDATAEEFESQDLDVEKIIPANSEGVVYLRPLSAGTYHFFGDFHQETAQGDITAK